MKKIWLYLPFVGHLNERKSFNSLFLVKWRLGPEKLEFFSHGHNSVPFFWTILYQNTFFPLHQTLSLTCCEKLVKLLCFSGLTFVCEKGNTILSRLLYRMIVNEHSINTSFYDVIEPRHCLLSFKTLSQTHWCTSTIRSPGPAFALCHSLSYGLSTSMLD